MGFLEQPGANDRMNENEGYIEAVDLVRSRVKQHLQDVFFNSSGFGMVLHTLGLDRASDGLFEDSAETQIALIHSPDSSFSRAGETNVHVVAYERLHTREDGVRPYFITHAGLDGDNKARMRHYGELLKPVTGRENDLSFEDNIKGAPFYYKNLKSGEMYYTRGTGNLLEIFICRTDGQKEEDAIFNNGYNDAASAVRYMHRLLDLIDLNTLVASTEVIDG